ncbi:unnamed protein product, partial [Cylicostephanus goldi]
MYTNCANFREISQFCLAQDTLFLAFHFNFLLTNGGRAAMICWLLGVLSAWPLLLPIDAGDGAYTPNAADGSCSVTRTMTEVGGSYKDSLTQ